MKKLLISSAAFFILSAFMSNTVFAAAINIIPRSGWGADETIRLWDDSRPKPDAKEIDIEYTEKFSDELELAKKIETNSSGQTLTWPLEYAKKVSKFIIHHTASTKNLDNPALAIRNIYNWHSLGRGWGDIGYNYIIDQQGKIYEGRYGGEGVVGAHAGKSNTGSIGIAVLGNYEENDAPEAVINSLAKLISVKSAIYNINPLGSSLFRGSVTPNVLGHKDVDQTLCPGKYLYEKLNIIRKLASQTITTTIEKTIFRIQKNKGYDYEDLSKVYYVSMNPNETRKITLKIKNTGTVAWPAGTKLVVNETSAFADKLDVKIEPEAVSAAAGGEIIFTATLTSKYKEGLINLNIAPFVGNKIKLEKYIQIPVNIMPPNYSYEIVASSLPSGSVKSGAVLTGWIDLKNIGDVPWFRSGPQTIKLGTNHSRDRLSEFLAVPSARIAFLQQARVNPGEVARFIFNLRAPAEADEYIEYFTPVVEGVRWLEDKSMNFKVFVYNYPYNYKVYGISSPNTFAAAETKTVWIKLRNTGKVSWTQDGENKLALQQFASSFKMASYKLVEKEIKPGGIATIEINLTAPQKSGDYEFRFRLRVGKTLLTRKPLSIFGTVAPKESQATGQQNLIKIALSFEGSPIITANGDFRLTSSSQLLRNYKAGDEVSVSYDGLRYKITSKDYSATSNNPVKFESGANVIIEIKNYEKRPEWNKNLNDNRFRGNLGIVYYKDKLRIINELPIEDYLKGVAETSSTDPYEKIKAIMIAARTYATYYTTKAEKFPGAPYNLDDDPATTQKYLGYGYELRAPTTVKAVKETAGTVITYADEPIKAAYFSSSDGRTRSYKEVWGSDVPYLQSVSDSYCKTGILSGHGVGLSGCGAKGMAEAGKKFDEILKYYYKGIELKKIY
ncbi:SpoIID/LytB domain-containing protein [Candidatus Peregrinibacteria bacterium]|nr:SpoIID/LytB domain-containing protein [Candidatus Peregrinibacteria bacterium]